jgi:hypothetical protein
MTQPFVTTGFARSAFVPRTDGLRDGLREVLSQARVCPERLRDVIVRFATAAREWAAAVDDVVLAVQREARPFLDRLPDARRVEIAASIQWWAVHGFHRGD